MLSANLSYCRPQFCINVRRKMCFLHCIPRKQCSYFKRYLGSTSGNINEDSAGNYQFGYINYHKEPMSVRVLSSGASGTPKTLLMTVFGLSYLFNCGESTERKIKQSRLGLGTLRGILLTSLSWENIGGLPSIMLMASSSKPLRFLYVYGPKGADVLLSASENFINYGNLKFKFGDFDELSHRKLPHLTIRPVILQSTDKTPYRDDLQPTRKNSGNHVNYFSAYKKEFSSSTINSQELNIEKDVSVAYICNTVGTRKPLLNISKCVKRGVPPGPLIAQLQKGEDITLPDGAILKLEDVTSNRSWNSTVIVVECPTSSYLDSLLSADGLKEFQVHKMQNILIAHLSPSSVMKDPRYIQWMHRFPLDTKHLVVNDINSCVGESSVLWRQNFMNLLNPQIFPRLRGVRAQTKQAPVPDDIKPRGFTSEERSIIEFSDSCIIDEIERAMSAEVQEDKYCENMSAEWRARWGSEATDLQLFEARNGTVYSLSRNLVLRDQEIWWNNLISKYIMNSVPRVKNVVEGIYDTYKNLGIYQEANSEEKYPHILFLGTSSTSAIRYRNTSGILLHICEDKSLLMDCGEGTLMQLLSFYEEAECQKVLCSLRAIYISHLHGDHHLGLTSILRARKTALAAAGNVSKPLLLLAPHTITDWLSLVHYHFSDILTDVTFVPLKDISIGRHSTGTRDCDNLLRRELDMQVVTTCQVDHCQFAYGVTFWHKDGWRITYSGDTRFCDALAEMGKNSDLLIHEATFGNCLGEMAYAKRHSTTEQAVLCGEKMQAKFTLLTHFSQRYPFLPEIDELIMMNKPNVSISFDFMKLNLQDLPTLPLLHPAYSTLFKRQQEKVKKRLEKKMTSHKATSSYCY